MITPKKHSCGEGVLHTEQYVAGYTEQANLSAGGDGAGLQKGLMQQQAMVLHVLKIEDLVDLKTRNGSAYVAHEQL